MDYRKDILVQVLEYMEKNIIEGLSVEKVSIVSGYSKWHLQRLFKHYFGITLGTYIRNRKLSRSAVLLKQHQGNILMSPRIRVCISAMLHAGIQTFLWRNAQQL